ncbi:MAG: response regulator, partial [Planctomycetes bacterium]|nr:response regulator [Planctomycetota bacterium]
ILDTLEILFRGEGYEVAVADSGPKALAALQDERPDIVLTDIRMPGATGLEVLSEAHQVDPEIAVILMTAQASLQSAVQAVNEGAYYYLQKPFANDELLAICRRAAEARQLKVENRRLKKVIRSRSSSGTHRRRAARIPGSRTPHHRWLHNSCWTRPPKQPVAGSEPSETP